MPTDACILSAAKLFRRAVHRAGQEPWRAKDINFPRGACGHASELLAYYLQKRLAITPEYVSQTSWNRSIGGWTGCHAWLEWKGLTIDISGDQFGWPPVIVTREPKHHGRGDDTSRFPALSDMNWWARECGSLWKAISVHLPD